MTDSLAIRPFQPADAEAVVSLWQEALPSEQPWNEPRDIIRRKCEENDGLFFVADAASEIVGTIQAGYDGVRGWIYSLAVAKAQRKQGIGRRLLETAERELAARGCPKVNLQVRESNREVLAFYERVGYQVEGRASLGKPLDASPREPVDPVPTIFVADDITLSQITWDDEPAYLKHLNETESFRDNMGSIPYPYTDLDARQWLALAMRRSLERDKVRNWAIRDAGGELIGGLGLMGLIREQKAELGYWLAQRFWGRGIVTKSILAVCRFAFEEYRLRKISARVFSGNTASMRVLEKAGFIQEGRLREHIFRNGTPRDLLCYALFPPKPPASAKNPPATDGIQTVEELLDAQIVELHEFYQKEWWSGSRSLEDVRQMLAHSDLIVALVEIETRKLIGFCRVLTDFTFRATIYDVIIAEPWRGRGLGKRLMETLAEHPRLKRVSCLWLCCEPKMVPFYERFGFQVYNEGPLWMIKPQREG